MFVYIALMMVVVISGLLLGDGAVQTVTDYSSIEFISTPNRNRFIRLVTFLLILIATIRAPYIGADTANYVSAIDAYKNYSWGYLLTHNVYPHDYEFGYRMFTKLCSVLGMSYTKFFFILALVLYIPLLKYIEKKSPNALVSTVLYIGVFNYLYSLGINRQAIAVVLCILSTHYIEKKKGTSFVIMVVATAFLFHSSAIMFLAVYPVSWFIYNHKDKMTMIYIAIIALEAVFVIGGRYVAGIILRILPTYIGYIGSIYATTSNGYLMIAFFDIILIGCMCITHNKSDTNISINIYISCLLICCLAQAASYSFAIMGRAVWYFSTFMIILIPFIVENIFEEKSKRIVYGVFIAFSIFYFVKTLMGANSTLVPFAFFWNV